MYEYRRPGCHKPMGRAGKDTPPKVPAIVARGDLVAAANSPATVICFVMECYRCFPETEGPRISIILYG